jgi:hypothetical protein
MIPISASDILKTLEAVPGWKAVIGLPKRLAELESRVAALEKGAKKPANGATECPQCGGELAFKGERPDPTFGRMGVKLRSFHCDKCKIDADRQWSAAKGYT